MFQIPRGTRDFSPLDMNKRKYLEEKFRNTFRSFGYNEIQTPTFETLELFTAKSGESIIEEIYSFEDKAGRKLALRPELTAAVIRFYVDKLQMEPKPLKLFYFGNCFRYDRPQKGRYREFMQAGCEIIGTNYYEAFAELIALSYKILRNAGLKNIELKIGNLTILKSIFKQFKISKDQEKYLVPLIDKKKYDDVKKALEDFNIKNSDINIILDLLKTDDIYKFEEYIDDKDTKEEFKLFLEIISLLKKSFKIKDCKIDMSIVRGLDYYKGLVFEIEAAILGAEKQICGGGVYELISLFGGTEIPTAGFAIGFDRTILALELENYKFPDLKIDFFIIPVNDNMLVKSIEIAQDLRNAGLLVDIDLLRRGVGKALKYANTKNASYSVIVGPDELEKDSVTIKDMKTGKQKIIAISKIQNYDSFF